MGGMAQRESGAGPRSARTRLAWVFGRPVVLASFYGFSDKSGSQDALGPACNPLLWCGGSAANRIVEFSGGTFLSSPIGGCS
jgi:hypothetical protein